MILMTNTNTFGHSTLLTTPVLANLSATLYLLLAYTCSSLYTPCPCGWALVVVSSSPPAPEGWDKDITEHTTTTFIIHIHLLTNPTPTLLHCPASLTPSRPDLSL